MSVEQTIKSHFSSIADIPEDKLDLNANLFEVYGIDSVKALKLISEVEVQFDVDIEQEEARKIRTLGDVCELITAKTNAA